jgi:hypothetical protein
VVYFDHFELAYGMRAEAESNRLLLPPGPEGDVSVVGFGEPAVRVVELLDARRPRALSGVRVEPRAGGTHSVHFRASTNPLGHVAYSLSGAQAPLSIEGVPASALRATSNAVDYLLLTHPSLEPEIQRLADFRSTREAGLRTRIVRMDEVYNEFSHGMESPHAIRRFLAHVRDHWAAPPRYVLFGGAGTFDYKNYLGYDENLVPCLLVDTPYGFYSSENALADVSGDDGVPEFAVGRLPASTPEEMRNLVDKIMAHESQANPPQAALLSADNPDTAGDFWRSADRATNHFPAHVEIRKTYLDPGETNVVSARNAFREALHDGTAVVVYLGHAAWNQFSGKGLWRSEDMPSLTNSPALPVVLAMSCRPTRFEFPGSRYVGEDFLMAQTHGGIACWGPSGESLNTFAETYCMAFLEAGRGGDVRLGELARQAASQAQASGLPRFMIDVMVLLGEPMTRYLQP